MGKFKPHKQESRNEKLEIDGPMPEEPKTWTSLKREEKEELTKAVEEWLEKRKKALEFRPVTGKERAAVCLARFGVKMSVRTAQALGAVKKPIVARWRHCGKMDLLRAQRRNARVVREEARAGKNLR